LLLTVAALGWLLGRTVIRPLAATGRAAMTIAAGDRDVHQPRSRVREVADVGTAVDTMAARLRTAAARQADLEEERPLFIAAIAHDLRTPFTARAHLDGLSQGPATTSERTARYLDACHTSTRTLFTPLYRGDTSRNSASGGPGLGLAITWRILRAHDGNLSADNGPSGGVVLTTGSRFGFGGPARPLSSIWATPPTGVGRRHVDQPAPADMLQHRRGAGAGATGRQSRE
jgi:signal transduction histidine kinase